MNKVRLLESNLFFGILLGSFITILSYRHSSVLLLVTGAIVFAISFFRPNSLAPVKKIWIALGEAMGKVFTPIVCVVLFFGVLTPIAVVMRLFLNSQNQWDINAMARSYWIDRRTLLGKFKDQF